MGPFVWETHGIHVGTGEDHASHGVDNVDEVVDRALRAAHPAITFVIHTPRLTRFRYPAERATDVKFIRGDAAYFECAERMARLQGRYAGRIAIRWGVELEWLGTGLGMEWSRAKLFQASGADFVIGSLHFAPDGTPYDGSQAGVAGLIERRGGLEQFWASYFDELVSMIDSSWPILSVVGHLDLPKLHAPLPRCFEDLDSADDEVARRLSVLLEMIAGRSLALDLNLSGLRKGVGAFPDPQILRRAHRLGIPVAIGSDTHSPEDLGRDYSDGIRIAREAGYRYYVSFSRLIPEKRPLASAAGAPLAEPAGMPATAASERTTAEPAGASQGGFRALNLAIVMLNQRLPRERRSELPRLSFGGGFAALAEFFPDSSSLGSYHAVRAWKGERSITITDRMPDYRGPEITCLFSHHRDSPGTLAVLFNMLASEEINVETAWLESLGDGTATAYLTVQGPRERIEEAVAFTLGTAPDRFVRIEPALRVALPPLKEAPAYLLELDGVWLPVPASRQMVVTVHANRPGVLLVLLSALASRRVNVIDLQLGARGETGFAALGVEGNERDVADVLAELGPGFIEASQLLLPEFGR